LLGPWALLPAEFSSESRLAPTGLGGPPPLYSCKPLESTFFRLSAHTSAQAAQLVCSTPPDLLPYLTSSPELLSYFTNFHQNKTIHYRHHGVSQSASLEHLELRHVSYTNSMLMPFAVKRRCTSTWSLSATLTPESRPPPAVSLPFRSDAGSQQLTFHIDLIYKCGGIDKRTIEKFEKVRIHSLSARELQACAGRPSERAAIFWLIATRGNLHGGVVRTFRRQR
jgi:hypothetical protein